VSFQDGSRQRVRTRLKTIDLAGASRVFLTPRVAGVA